MKKKVISLIASLIMVLGTGVLLPTSNVSYATQQRYYNFNVDVSITGDGAVDIVNLAKSMVGKNGAYFGYTEEWCADFVSDCAYLVNQSDAIPADGYCPNLQTKIKNAGGYYVDAKDAQPGDILFYGTNGGAHVEIVYANNNGVLSTIGGNSGDSDNSKSLVKDHKNQNGQPSVYKAMRPNYKTSSSTSVNLEVDTDWNSYLPIKAYTLSTNTTYVYNSDCKTLSGGEIWKDDECTIKQVYKNGWCQVQYPVSSGTRTAYTPLSTFMMESSLKYHGEANKEITTYKRVDRSEVYGSVSAGDICYFTGFAGDTTQVLYPISGGYKFGFIKYTFTDPDSPWYSSLTPVDIGDDWYGYIINSKEWKHLTNDGENVSFRTETGAKNQIWKFTKNSDGSYKITSLADGKVLDVTEESSENDANVGVYRDKNNNAQKWYIYGSSGQNFLKAACTDCVLDLDGGKFYEGVNAQMWKYDSSDDAEKFHLWELKKSAELSVNIGNSAGKTTFTWNSLRIADHYDVKIWNGTYWDGDYAYSDWHNKGTSSSFTLPAGHYEAYVDTVTPDGSVYMSNVVKFDVKAATFNVTFNANGGSVSTTSKTVTHNSTYGSLPTPTRTGYTFNGWYTSASGGTKITDTTKVTITANQTLYAQWTANGYTIAYNSNGGSGSVGNSSMTYDKAANLNSNSFTRTGYTFNGWNTKADGSGTAYADKASVKNLATGGTVTLYVQWKANNYTVTFDANGGSVSSTSQTATYNSTYGSLPTPTRTGYTFNGWFTEKTGGTKVTSDTKVTITANQTLYAQWSATDEVGKSMTEKEAAGQTIPDGDYWIYSGLDRNYYLDIPGNEIISNNANVEMWMSESGMPTKYDVWTVKYLNNGFYKITQYGTNICLDVVDISKLNNTNVQVYTENTTEAQQWSISQTETGYRIQSRCNGFYLDVEGAKVEKGTNVRVSKKNDDKRQSFCFIPYSPDERPLADGVYGIQSAKNSEYYVDAAGNTKDFTNGTNICIGDKMYDTFRVEYARDGYYKIFEATTGLALEVNNPAENHFSENQRNIQLYKSNDYSRGQLWKIRKTSDGHYFIISKLSGCYFDLLNGECVKGQNISQVYYVGGNAQKWNFVPTIIKGDANDDKTVDVADAVMLQKWLLGSGNLTNWKNVDLCEDGKIDVFDMIEMRKLIVNK